MSDSVHDPILAKMNRPARDRWRRWALAAVIVVILVGVMAIGAVAGIATRDWYKQRQADQDNLHAVVAVIQYNLQIGKIQLPPAPTPPPTPPAEPRATVNPDGSATVTTPKPPAEVPKK